MTENMADEFDLVVFCGRTFFLDEDPFPTKGRELSDDGYHRPLHPMYTKGDYIETQNPEIRIYLRGHEAVI